MRMAFFIILLLELLPDCRIYYFFIIVLLDITRLPDYLSYTRLAGLVYILHILQLLLF